MSHFTVMVVTDASPLADPELITRTLQPYHEYECTGTEDEYVVFVDEHEELLKEYNELEETKYRDKDGTLHDEHADCFYRPATPEELRRIGCPIGMGVSGGLLFRTDYTDSTKRVMVHDRELFAGYEPVTLRAADIYPDGLSEFAEDNGYVIEGGRLGRRTNPNKKWDWWQVGGRWSGELLVKVEAAIAGTAAKGMPGLMGMETDRGGVDICRVGDLDLDGMKARNVAKRRKLLEDTCRCVREDCGLDEAGLHERYNAYTRGMIKARADYAMLPKTERGSFADFLRSGAYPDLVAEIEAARGVVEVDGQRRHRCSVATFTDYFGPGVPEGLDFGELEDWITSAPAFCTFAVLKDGEWYERGSMGWWGMVADDKGDEWNSKFNELLYSLSPDQWITVVDCHI